MELAQNVERSLKIGNMGYENLTLDEENDIINLDFKGKSYRLIIEEIEE
jgi:hypothetical protein